MERRHPGGSCGPPGGTGRRRRGPVADANRGDPFDGRDRWNPSLLRFGIKPWEMDDFTPDELAALDAWIKELNAKNGA
jgi:hypothetical protein